MPHGCDCPAGRGTKTHGPCERYLVMTAPESRSLLHPQGRQGSRTGISHGALANGPARPPLLLLSSITGHGATTARGCGSGCPQPRTETPTFRPTIAPRRPDPPPPPGRDGSGISSQRGQRREGQPGAEPRAELTPDGGGAELVEEHGRGADRHRSAGWGTRRSRGTPSVATATPPGWGAARGQGCSLQQDAPAQH